MRTPLIIIEGTDNCGKDLLISKLLGYFDTATVIHCHGPKKDDIFANLNQDKQFYEYFEKYDSGEYDSSEVVIMNRSHYGEYVYGQIYRNRDSDDIIKMINEIDNTLIFNNPVLYIQLVNTSLVLRHNNDDNKSLSKLDDELMEKETTLFGEIFAHSALSKLLVQVNDGDEFRDPDEIFEAVKAFLNEYSSL